MTRIETVRIHLNYKTKQMRITSMHCNDDSWTLNGGPVTIVSFFTVFSVLCAVLLLWMTKQVIRVHTAHCRGHTWGVCLWKEGSAFEMGSAFERGSAFEECGSVFEGVCLWSEGLPLEGGGSPTKQTDPQKVDQPSGGRLRWLYSQWWTLGRGRHPCEQNDRRV